MTQYRVARFPAGPNAGAISATYDLSYHMAGANDEVLDNATSTELQAFLAATAPKPPRPTPRQWLERLSDATQLALETASLSNATVSLWLRKATGASDGIDVTLTETKTGVAAMVSAGLLTSAEATTLLTP